MANFMECKKEGKEHRRQWKTKEREDRDRKLLIVTKS
jgi:IS5 family transposase